MRIKTLSEKYDSPQNICLAGIKVQTGLKGGLEGCEAILCRMDELIAGFQELRGQMGQMAQQMAGNAQ